VATCPHYKKIEEYANLFKIAVARVSIQESRSGEAESDLAQASIEIHGIRRFNTCATDLFTVGGHFPTIMAPQT
jgi:hypothetical protein